MSELIRPRRLKRGSRVAVLSPASTPKPERVAAGRARLQALGYEVVLGEHAEVRGPLYYAGTLEQRLGDLHAAFADPAIDGILCTRGGWGSAELLPYLDRELIAANPKPFVGYSDHTSLHLWLRERVQLVTFYGPMVAADFARDGGVDLRSWSCALDGVGGSVGGGVDGEVHAAAVGGDLRGEAVWSVGVAEGLRVLRPGVAEGELGGGCLSIFAEALGTPFACGLASAAAAVGSADRAEVQRDGGVLFLEDIGVKPYQWDRMLLHLRYAGVLDRVQGIVFGDMAQCVATEEMDLLERAILHGLGDFAGPVAIGLRCGHVDGANVTLPLGVRVRLDLSDAGNPAMHFLESAVSG